MWLSELGEDIADDATMFPLVEPVLQLAQQDTVSLVHVGQVAGKQEGELSPPHDRLVSYRVHEVLHERPELGAVLPLHGNHLPHYLLTLPWRVVQGR